VTSPVVDVIIPVHTASRPVARAVASVVDGAAMTCATVVAHNIEPETIRARLGAYADHPRVRILSLADGIPSPAGPMNHGLAHSEADFVSVLGSDDELAPGAVDSWLAVQRRTGASVVLARIRTIGRGVDPYPPVRRGRRRSDLDFEKDRLVYRSAPLGLIDRRRHGDLRFTEGLTSGEDLAFSASLWMEGRHIAYDLTGPAYVGHEDAGDRVTHRPRPVREDFAFLAALESRPWFGRLSAAQRRMIAVKTIRIHYFDAVSARIGTPLGLGPYESELAEVLRWAERLAPGFGDLLSIADHRAIAAVQASAPRETVAALLAARGAYRTPAALVPRRILLAAHRQAPFRTLLAGWLTLQTPERGL
jgi:hypothetical protein